MSSLSLSGAEMDVHAVGRRIPLSDRGLRDVEECMRVGSMPDEGVEWEMDDCSRLGKVLDERPAGLRGDTVGMWMAASLLRIRDREGMSGVLWPNAAQRAFEARRGREQHRAEGAADGDDDLDGGAVLSEDDHAARRADGAGGADAGGGGGDLPDGAADLGESAGGAAGGAAAADAANAGQMVFAELDSEFRVLSAGDENAGRGLTVQNLHCSEVSRWPGDAAATLAGLRAALAPGGEVVLESTPNGAYGCFYEEWMEAAGARAWCGTFFRGGWSRLCVGCGRR